MTPEQEASCQRDALVAQAGFLQLSDGLLAEGAPIEAIAHGLLWATVVASERCERGEAGTVEWLRMQADLIERGLMSRMRQVQ